MSIYVYDYKVKYSDVGKNNKLTLKALVNTLQEAAVNHSEQAGYGVNNIKDTHLAWLLLDWKVQVFSYPHSNEEITITTWPKMFDKLYSYRDFKIYDSKNNVIAQASSKWFAINTETKKIRKMTPEIISAYGNPVTDSVFDEPFKNNLIIPNELTLNFNYTVQRRDIDTNGHVNNLNYIDYAIETLPDNVFDNNTFYNLEIVYKKEIKFKEKVNCYYSFENNQHIVTIKNKDNSIVHALVKLY